MTDIIKLAREAGMKASIGKTDKQGNYHPNVNALFSSVPIEWLERFAELVAAPLKADAERLDWMQKHCLDHNFGEPFFLFEGVGKDIRAAIDAARAKEQT